MLKEKRVQVAGEKKSVLNKVIEFRCGDEQFSDQKNIKRKRKLRGNCCREN